VQAQNCQRQCNLNGLSVTELKGGAVDTRPDSCASRRSLRPGGRRPAPERTTALSSVIFNITFDCADPRALARFWSQVAGWPVTEDARPGYAEAQSGQPTRPPAPLFRPGWRGQDHQEPGTPRHHARGQDTRRGDHPAQPASSLKGPEFGWVLQADPEGPVGQSCHTAKRCSGLRGPGQVEQILAAAPAYEDPSGR